MRAATYAQLSDDGLSIPDQQERCRRYAEDRGWDVVGEFVDRHKSAYKKDIERKGFDALLTAASDGKIDVIVTRHWDRLTRNFQDLVRLNDLADERGVKICEYESGEVDDFRGDISTVLAKRESKIKSDRARAAAARNIQAGKRTRGGPRPFGYDVKKVEAGPATEDGKQRHRVIDRADFLAIKKRIATRDDQIQHEIDKLQTRGSLRKFGDLSQVRRAWESWDLYQRRALLNAVVDKITVRPHPGGMPTHPVSGKVMADRLDIKWLA